MRISNQALSELQAKLGYRFDDISLLMLAMTHRSAEKHHNQRLEFLGDAVLGFIVAEALYQLYPDAPEGDLSQLRAALVNRETLSTLARSLSLGELLVLGQGERKSGGHERDSILCDALEAMLGAIYLDGGTDACRGCILKLLKSRLQHDPTDGASKDPKTRLQELLQAAALPVPDYQVVAVRGEEHDQEFDVSCSIALLTKKTRGTGRSRRLAEQQAAKQALVLLQEKQTQGKTGE
ncbi:ribonuclease III [Pseudohongiella acticola]|jgi:ribonuclease III|uniref:Ribonuclease 3 n=1 Tax=Pseudohongiella acticola TaxID=1524254 RepID=A0A1E8CI82_9GAMM|nr:ribonuclease III [Pseudohongiella acticola]OFE11967.1 ribonuclease III [Pseudohongiella acticola]